MLKNSGWVGDENISAMRKTAGSGPYRAPSWVVFGRGRGGWGWEIQQKLQLNKKNVYSGSEQQKTITLFFNLSNNLQWSLLNNCCRALARQHTILFCNVGRKIQKFLRSRVLSGTIETTITRTSHGCHARENSSHAVRRFRLSNLSCAVLLKVTNC